MKGVRERARGPELELLTAVIGPTGYFPDFLTAPPGEDPAPEDDLAVLAGVDDEQVSRDLGKVVPRRTGPARSIVASLAENPSVARDRLGAARRVVWEQLLAPYWGQVRRLLHADVAHRSRVVASAGTATMVQELHERVGWRDGAVTVRLRWFGDVVDCGGSGLVLVPTVFGAPWCSVVTEPPGIPTVFYPALAVGQDWHRPVPAAALDRLLGRGRAEVLRCLEVTRTTSEVAESCGLAVSTASHHLAVLREGGLVLSVRDGGAVRHSRSLLGETMLRG